VAGVTVHHIRQQSAATAGLFVWLNGVLTYCEAARELGLAEKRDPTSSFGSSFRPKPPPTAEAAAKQASPGR
jgi:hypothetical protein